MLSSSKTVKNINMFGSFVSTVWLCPGAAVWHHEMLLFFISSYFFFSAFWQITNYNNPYMTIYSISMCRCCTYELNTLFIESDKCFASLIVFQQQFHFKILHKNDDENENMTQPYSHSILNNSFILKEKHNTFWKKSQIAAQMG